MLERPKIKSMFCQKEKNKEYVLSERSKIKSILREQNAIFTDCYVLSERPKIKSILREQNAIFTDCYVLLERPK